MATATLAVERPIDPQIERDFHRAQAELTKAENQLQGEERTLAELTAQFNEQCKLQAAGKKADPQACRDKMSAVEQRIIGLKSIAGDRQNEFEAAALRRNQALGEQQEQLREEHLANLRRAHNDARKAVTNANRALRAAQDEERRAGAALNQALMSNLGSGSRGRR